VGEAIDGRYGRVSTRRNRVEAIAYAQDLVDEES
jgi:hypothetical protein